MFNNRRENKLKSFFSGKIFLFTIILLVFVVFFIYLKGFYQDYKVKQEINSLKQEIVSLEKKKLESMEILSYVMSSDFVEEKARTELNLQKDGENVVFFQNDTEYQSSDTKEEKGQEKTVHLSNPLKWWYYFTHKSIE